MAALLYSALIGCSADASALPSASIVSTVGNQVVLPCSWKPPLGEVAPPDCHIVWSTLVDTVFERRGVVRWEADEFQGRLEVPEERLRSGNCSLIIRDVQIADTGSYESFMVVNGARSKKTRVSLQTVKLSVYDHKTYQSHHPGEDFVLQLYTQHSMSVVFQGRDSSVWTDVWLREEGNSERVVKHPLLQQLTMRKVQHTDEGVYKVLDENGLAVSTVQLTVEENPAPSRQFRTQENIPTDVAASSSGSALLILPLLVCSLQIVRLV
ncbi:galectin 17 isoform X2 [Parambassis ranga]|uniref:Galectin 17 isoform X2 n=1 Tax=Parambassis ranga TaxID=210632 RepID=A0A6P7HKX0_9TELE|nr:uncharacterized protein LOC114432436 isoform X2 [Parambassis ranga]